MYNDTQKCGAFLNKMNTIQLDKLMSRVLHEMRRRDSDHVKGDVVKSSHALGKLRAIKKSA
jgi:hypothetical protein